MCVSILVKQVNTSQASEIEVVFEGGDIKSEKSLNLEKKKLLSDALSHIAELVEQGMRFDSEDELEVTLDPFLHVIKVEYTQTLSEKMLSFGSNSEEDDGEPHIW